MTKHMHMTLKALLIILACLMMLAPHALAMEIPTMQVQASVTLDGTLPAEDEDFVVKMQGKDDAKPVSMTISGEGTNAFPTMEYTEVGEYEYRLWQEAGTNKKCTYDDSVYHLTVYVTNEENGDGLDIAAALYKDGGKKKVSEVVFHNEYEVEKAEIEEEGPYTGDGQNLMLYFTLLTVSGLMLIVLRSKVNNKK